MKIGDLVKLAKWCKNGPALMQVMDIDRPGDYGYANVIFLEGPKMGLTVKATKGNIFSIEEYDEAMRKHCERR